jgi:hypothetical protein
MCASEPDQPAEVISLLDRPWLIQNAWTQPEDRGPSLREQVKMDQMRPLPDNVIDMMDVVADRLSKNWI